jgi:TatD DNase family protein
MKPEFFDIHSHINDKKFDGDIVNVIKRMNKESVWTIAVGTDRRSSQLAAQISCFYEGVFSAIGIHPTDNTAEHFNEPYFEELAGCKSVVAVGECGLDYFRAKDLSDEEKRRQKDLFEKQLEFAIKIDRPLMIHCRNAHADMLDILTSKKKEHGEKLRGNIHFFSEGVETAKKYFDLDFSISFTGVLTFTTDYDEVVKYAPGDMIMSETDSPYVSPVPHRGERNEPNYVKEVVKRIAQIRGEDYEKVEKAMVDNAFRIFNINT